MWHPMTIEEYARMEQANGEKLVQSDGVWWRRVRPFFYQPVFPFLEMTPGSHRPPKDAWVGGFQHLVPESAPANSCRHFVVWDDVQDYSLETLPSKKRSTIKRGMKHFSITFVEDRDEFIRSGHEVYRSFFARTGYSYRKDRVDAAAFAQWANALYSVPQMRVMGAYHGSELCAVEISCLVEDVLVMVSLFAKTECLRDQVVDALAHELRSRAAACGGIKYIYKGLLTGNRGIDASKLRRGCKIVTKPAWFQVNPLARLLLMTCMPGSYRKLHGDFDFNIEYHGREAVRETTGPLPAVA